MLHKIWNPKENDLMTFKVLFIVSIPVCILLPITLNLLLPSVRWYLLGLLLLIIVTAIRIVSSIRYQAKISSNLETKSNKLFGKLSDEDRRRFIRNAFIFIPIIFILGMAIGLFLIKLIQPLSVGLVTIIALFLLAIYLFSIWIFYNKLAQGKEDILF